MPLGPRLMWASVAGDLRPLKVPLTVSLLPTSIAVRFPDPATFACMAISIGTGESRALYISPFCAALAGRANRAPPAKSPISRCRFMSCVFPVVADARSPVLSPACRSVKTISWPIFLSERTEARFEVAEKRRRIQAFAGRPGDDLLGRQTLADLMDICPEPGKQAGKLSAADFLPHRVGALISLRKLRGVEAAERIGREIPEHAQRPVDILQHAVLIGGGLRAQKRGAALVPDVRQVAHRKGAGEKRHLELVSEHAGQMIRHFDGIDAVDVGACEEPG